MKVVLISIGKTNEKYLNEGISIYSKRLKHYTPFEMIDIHNLKKTSNFSKSELIKKEGDLILKNIQNTDYLVLLDVKGKEYNSLNFSQKIQRWMLTGKKKIIFLWEVYGFSKDVYDRSDEQLSLSKMTFFLIK